MKKVKSILRISSLCAMFATTIAVRSSAATQSAYQLPSNTQVVEYLAQSANWYRHLYAERQVANEPGDLLFLDDNQTIEAQIVKLSFEFATADAAARATQASSRSYAAGVQPTTPPSNLAHFIELKNRSDEECLQAVQTISALKQKIGIARKPDRKKLNAALDDAQRRLELLHAVSQTVNHLIESVGRVETGQTDGENLDSTINDLANSIPDLNNLAKLPAKDASSRSTDSWRNEGLLELRSEVSTLKLKLGVIDEKIRLTNDLAFSNRNLRIPMTGFISQVLRNSLISDAQTSDLASLGQQNTELSALTLQLKEFSPTIVALDKQKALLAEYNSHLLSWRTTVVSQYRREWKKLVFRLIAITLIIGLVIGVSELSRRLAFRRVRDPNRRRFIGISNRVLTLLAICIVVLFGLALDLNSLATYFGLLTAGMAVALQSVILAVFSHFLLVGKYGLRIGDRVQISGITGDIIDMGLLQFQLREFDMQKQCFTGHIATFSNSLVFVSPATGLLKFDSSPENVA